MLLAGLFSSFVIEMTPFSRKYLVIVAALVLLLATILYVAPPRSSDFKASALSVVKPIETERLEAGQTESSTLRDYKRPAFFSIFKFIISFIPGTQR